MVSTLHSFGQSEQDVESELLASRRRAFQRALASVRPEAPRPKAAPLPPPTAEQMKNAPRACLVACDDGGVDLASIAGCDASELAVVQCAGTNVPMIGAADGPVAAEIQLALALGVRELVLCGVGPTSSEGLGGDSWTEAETAAARPLGTALAWADVRRRMLLECRRLRAVPAVAQRLSEGALRLHVWIHNPESGELLAYDGRLARFVALGARVGDSPVERARLPRM